MNNTHIQSKPVDYNSLFNSLVTRLTGDIDKFKQRQPFVYTYMSERIELAIELMNAGNHAVAWRIIKRVDKEVRELLGQYTYNENKNRKKTRYFYKGNNNRGKE